MFWNGRTEKHQTSTARFRLAEENGQRCPFPVPCALFPHPLQNRVPRGECVPVARKLRADRSGAETKSFCPCQKSAETLRFCRFSFFMCCMVEVFTLVQTSGFCIHLHLPATALNPSSTQNAPGFAFFWLNRVRFPLFCCFSGAKFSCWFLCILPHSGYKLKPSVIPCRREVSFLT